MKKLCVETTYVATKKSEQSIRTFESCAKQVFVGNGVIKTRFMPYIADNADERQLLYVNLYLTTSTVDKTCTDCVVTTTVRQYGIREVALVESQPNNYLVDVNVAVVSQNSTQRWVSNMATIVEACNSLSSTLAKDLCVRRQVAPDIARACSRYARHEQDDCIRNTSY